MGHESTINNVPCIVIPQKRFPVLRVLSPTGFMSYSTRVAVQLLDVFLGSTAGLRYPALRYHGIA